MFSGTTQNKPQEAAQLLVNCGHAERAVELLMDAGMPAEAEALAAAQGDSMRGRVTQHLLKTRARWAEAAGQWDAAAQLLVQLGEASHAVSMCNTHGAWDVLAQLARRLDPKTDAAALHALVAAARAAGNDDLARDVLMRLGDHTVGSF